MISVVGFLKSRLNSPQMAFLRSSASSSCSLSYNLTVQPHVLVRSVGPLALLQKTGFHRQRAPRSLGTRAGYVLPGPWPGREPVLINVCLLVF